MENEIEEVRKGVIENFFDVLNDFLNKTQSPIEELFALKMLKSQEAFYVQNRINRLPLEYFEKDKQFEEMEATIDFYGRTLLLIPQFKVQQYHTIDFLLYLPKYDIRIAIECDGHDFHEKTKEQAKKDKQRDRYLVANNFYIFRYSGSEIYEKGNSIFREIEDFLINLLRKR